ncbi:MAG: hypothetical protein ACI4NI_07360 [Candidatus Ornithospirochaeta sp.]
MTDKLLVHYLSQMQGTLFEMSGREGYDSETFIRVFMRSRIAEGLDSDFDFTHWAGKEYTMERMSQEYPEGFSRQGTVFDRETLYWAGYLYRYWHFYTGESSKEIYKQADADTINTMYYGYHTLDIKMAIDRLKDGYKHRR